MDHKIEQPTQKRMLKSTVWILVLLGIVLLMAVAGAGYYFYNQHQAKLKAAENAEKAGITTKVTIGDLTETLDDISGTVRSNQSVYLYWQISGTVSAVNVKVGDTVKKGDVLASLDRSTISSSVIEAEQTKETAEENLKKLYTSSLDMATKLNAVATAKSAVDDAQDARNALGITRTTYPELGDYYQKYLNASRDYDLALSAYNEVKDRALDDADRERAVSRLENAQTSRDSALSMYNWYNGETNELEVQQADAALLLAQSKYDDAVRAYDKVKNGPTQDDINSLQAQIDSAQAIMNTADIISPIDGTVAEVDVKPYDVIAYESTSTTRDILAVRIDNIDSYYIDVSVAEANINSISQGQEVTVTFDAIPLKEYTGVITNISNAGTVSDSSVTYAVTVQMDNVDGEIKSGIMGDVSIVTQEVKDAKIVPSTALSFDSDGNRIVKKKNSDGTFTNVKVQIGLISGSDVQVISDDLAEGDEVQKNTTTTTTSDQSFSFKSMFGGGGGGGGGMPGGGGPGGGGMPGGGGPR